MENELIIIGFGNQAKAWAQNLRDSNYTIKIFLREGSKSIDLVKTMGFELADKSDISNAKKIAILTPDDTHENILKTLGHSLKDNTTIIYAHGFSLTYDKVYEKFKNLNHVLLAPKAIASELRFQFECKGGLGGVYSFEFIKDAKIKKEILKLGSDLGLNILHESTSEQETIADLFSEQSLLCSTLPYSALKSFNKLIQNGIDPEVAYFECWYELKLIVDTLVKIGPYQFFKLISPNALLGSEVGKNLFYDMDYDKKLDDMLKHIQSGDFVNSIKDVNYDEIKSEVLDFWKDQKINKLHDNLKDELFKG